MSFRVDILDSSGNAVGDGPLASVEQVRLRRSLDKVGGASFTTQGTDKKTSEVGTGRQYRIYHSRWGLLGTFSHAHQKLSISGHRPKLEVEAYDELIQLVRKNVYFRRNFNHVAVDSVVSDLVGLASGWSAGAVESGIGNTTVSYEGESVFEALDVLRDRWGRHFRLNGSQTLDFGSFGADSGIRLVRAEHAPKELESNDSLALVTNLEVLTEGETIINRVIPVGAGAGVTQLSLENVTSEDASYPVLNAANGDGSLFYYIEDATSQASYGLVERAMERSDVRPLTNSTVNLQNAANALYRAALAYLLKYKSPRTTYRVQVTKLDPALLPGDTVNLVYRGIANQNGRPYKWVDVEADLWVLDIEEAYSTDGQQTVALTVATSADRRTQDEDVLAQLVRDTKVFKTHVQPNLTHSPVGPYVKRMDSSRTATFNVRLKEEVLAVNRVVLRFITSPLRASVTASVGESAHTHTVNIGAGGGHTHTVNVGAGGSHDHDITHQHEIHVQEKGVTAYPTMHLDTITPNMRYDGAGGVKTVFTDVISVSTSDAASHTHPGETALSNTHSHPGETALSNTHSHPGETAESQTHSHPGEATGAGSAHNHAMTYGLFEDTTYPQVISVTINGVNRTSVLGGTWAPTNATVDVEVDITQYINRGQDNTVVFSCTTGQGELTFLADCLLTIQAIVVT